ncbi:MAG: hypothetical protein HKM06_01375 [Spirochaetales bacterium]|nr:hypothetical protein [Spirochaetales bacterium]
MRNKVFWLLLTLAGAGNLPAQTVDLISVFEQIPVTERLSWLEAKPLATLPNDFLFQALLFTDAANIEEGSDNEVQAKVSTAVWLCNQLGQRHDLAAALLIRRLPSEYQNTGLRIASWDALAQIHDPSSIPEMILALKTLNAGFRRNIQGEREALALVLALRELKAKEAFADLLRASDGWYSQESHVRQEALKSLSLVVPDEFKSLMEVLSKDIDPSARQIAYQLAMKNPKSELCAEASSTALHAALNFDSVDASSQEILSSLLMNALRYLSSASEVPDSAVSDLKSVLRGWSDPNQDPEEARLAASALGRNGSLDAVKALSTTLHELNNRQKAGANSPSDVVFAVSLIQSLGVSHSKAGRAALSEVPYSSYAPAIVHQADEALRMIPST